MTNEEAKEMLKAKLECMNRFSTGCDLYCTRNDCDNCSLCYEQGNIGEQKEALELAIKALDQEPRKGHWIKGYTYPDGEYWECDKCNELIKVKYPMHYCNNCGSDNRKVEE